MTPVEAPVETTQLRTLFHYTNEEGMNGIVQSGKLRVFYEGTEPERRAVWKRTVRFRHRAGNEDARPTLSSVFGAIISGSPLQSLCRDRRDGPERGRLGAME